MMNWCFWTVVWYKTLNSPLDCKEIKQVHPKGDQLWVFIGRTDVEAETPILWPPDVKSWLIWKDPDAGKDWRQEETGMTEDATVGWHHQFDGHEFEQALGDGERTGKPGVLKSMRSQRVGHNWVTEWQQHFIANSGNGAHCSFKRELFFKYLSTFSTEIILSLLQFSSVTQSCPTLCDPHGLQHSRLPCPSPTPRACSNSCPSSWWCHPTILSSVFPVSSCLQSFPASGSFQMSQFFTPGSQSIGA